MLRVDWSKLSTELLEIIVNKLSFFDKFSFKLVCSSWRFAVLNLSLVSSSSQFPKSYQLPLLMLPTDGHVEKDNNRGYCFYNLDDQKLSDECTNMWEHDQGSRCVGSSKGWLLLVYTEKSESSLYIFNPFYITAKKIVLPSFKSPPNFTIDGIIKSVLTWNPIEFSDNFGVVFLYECGLMCSRVSLLMYDVHTHEKSWTDLQLKDDSYGDVICTQDLLYALSDNFDIEVWNLGPIRDGSEIKKVKHIQILSPKVNHVPELSDQRQRYTAKTYLVEKENNFLLVIRCIGEVVTEDGEVVDEGALLDDQVYSHINASYLTKNIYVYKLDNGQKEWLKVGSLENQVLFLGVNESFPLSTTQECQRNSIYFTDDYWDHIRMHDCQTLVGHDMGVFSLNDRSIKQIFPSELKKIIPPPIWVHQTKYRVSKSYIGL